MSHVYVSYLLLAICAICLVGFPAFLILYSVLNCRIPCVEFVDPSVKSYALTFGTMTRYLGSSLVEYLLLGVRGGTRGAPLLHIYFWDYEEVPEELPVAYLLLGLWGGTSGVPFCWYFSMDSLAFGYFVFPWYVNSCLLRWCTSWLYYYVFCAPYCIVLALDF